MPPVPAVLVDFQSAADVAGKRQTLRGWAEPMLRAALTRNRVELMNEPDSVRCRQILSGSILIRCELARRQTGVALGEQPPVGKADTAAERFA